MSDRELPPSKEIVAAWITRAMGERCKTYSPTCYLCAAWKHFDATKWPTHEPRPNTEGEVGLAADVGPGGGASASASGETHAPELSPALPPRARPCTHRFTIDGIRNPRPDDRCDGCGETWADVQAALTKGDGQS